MPPLSPVPEDSEPYRHHSLPPPPRIFRPDILLYDGNGSKESIIAYSHAAAGEFYGPRIRGLETEASTLSEDEDDGKRPVYRRPAVIVGYVVVLFMLIATATAVGVVCSRPKASR